MDSPTPERLSSIQVPLPERTAPRPANPSPDPRTRARPIRFGVFSEQPFYRRVIMFHVRGRRRHPSDSRRRARRSLFRPALEALEARWLPSARQMEALGRGLVAVNRGGGSVYVGWRLLGTDPADVAFNLYRSTGGEAPVLLNGEPLTQTTDFVDRGMDLLRTNTYFVRPVLDGVEGAAG